MENFTSHALDIEAPASSQSIDGFMAHHGNMAPGGNCKKRDAKQSEQCPPCSSKLPQEDGVNQSSRQSDTLRWGHRIIVFALIKWTGFDSTLNQLLTATQREDES